MRERGSLGLGGIVLILVFVGMLAVGYSQWRAERGQLGEAFVGKVVALSGPFNDVGVVEEFRVGKSLVIRSESSDFSKQAYYQLDRACSVVVLAESLDEYRERLAQDRQRAAAEAAQVGRAQTAPESPRPTVGATPMPRFVGGVSGSVTSALSPTKERARQEWDDFISHLSLRVEELDALSVEAMSSCSGTTSGWQDSAPFSATAPDSRGGYLFLQGETGGSAVSMDNATSPECRSAVGRFESLLERLQSEIRQAESQATNSGFYSEDRLPILKKYGMQDVTSREHEARVSHQS